jgi:hypothetical protein
MSDYSAQTNSIKQISLDLAEEVAAITKKVHITVSYISFFNISLICF